MKLTQLLNIKYPIIQGGMARIARGELAAAVANAGGLGLVGTGGFTVEEFKKELQIAKEKTLPGKVFGVNIVLMEKDIEEKVQIAIEEKVAAVTLAAGNPAPYIPRFLEAGIKVIAVIANSKMAKKVESLGAHACVMEGLEAGGHIGSLTTMASLIQIVQSVNIPVVAAGGFGHGAQILAAQVMGAAGVQMGTRFLVADETPIHDNFKQALIDATDFGTDVTGAVSGHGVRQLSNKMTQEYIKLEKQGASEEELMKVVAGSLGRAVFEGDRETGSMMAGQIAGILQKRDSVQGIFDQLVQEYQEAKKAIQAQEDFLF